MNKHTPGPWSVDSNDIYLITSDKDGEVVCEIAEREIVSQGGTWETNVSVMDANAHLIAAAPAMYEALKALLAHEGERQYSGIGTEHDSGALEGAKRSAKTALAQAEGLDY